MKIVYVIYNLLKTAGYNESAVIRDIAIKDIKIAYLVLISLFKITVAHCKLVKIAEHGIISIIHSICRLSLVFVVPASFTAVEYRRYRFEVWLFIGYEF